MAESVVQAVTHFQDSKKLYQVSMVSGDGMSGINCLNLEKQEVFQFR